MSYDFAARSFAAHNRIALRRLATIDTLARGIAEHLRKGLPGEMADPPTISSNVSTSEITGGVTYGFQATNPANDHRSRYALYGGRWRHRGATYPSYLHLGCWTTHWGNGTDPTAAETEPQSGCVRFTTWADKFEVSHNAAYGWRMKVNGQYVKAGLIGHATVDSLTANGAYFHLFDFGAPGLKFVELEWDAGPIYFKGIVVPPTYTVEPWPHANQLKISLFGDSMVSTIVDTADTKLALTGAMPQVIRALTGQPDVWAQGVGATGFIADNSGTRSDFVERATVDFPFYGPFDVVIEIGGRNDSTSAAGALDTFQAKVEEWIEIVLENNPDAIICMTGPQSSSGTEAYNTNTNGLADKQDRKKAAAAKYPKNCLFIETVGNAANPTPWITGNGKVGTPGSTKGNADRLGGDGVHRSIQGHAEIGARIVQEIGRRLPLLASRIRNGVIAGVNDGDLT